MNELTLYDIIIEHGTYYHNTNRHELDVEDLNLSWTFWDDDINVRTDDNGDIRYVSAIAINERGSVVVVWDDDFEEVFASLDYDDEDGNNCAEYIREEIMNWTEDKFEDEDEDEGKEEGVLPYDKFYLSDAYDNLKEYLTLDDLIEHMFNFFTSDNLHDFAEHLLEELGLEVKNVM